MYPDMTWCIVSTDPTFVGAMENLLGFARQEVFTAASWEEYERLQ